MKQLTQQLKSGKMQVLEVPFPILKTGNLLVRTHFSVISSGTEGKTVKDARKGYIAKAKSRQKEVKQVFDTAKKIGVRATYKLVMNKLESFSSLGYSAAGQVIGVGEDVTEFEVGDFVACGGPSAGHAEVISVPKRLCVKIPSGVDLIEASFTTLASIAIQGIRQADLRFGETCVIIGMGLIGQLTYKILESSGMFPIGIDISKESIEFCRKMEMSRVYHRYDEGLDKVILGYTRGRGVDVAIIAAGTSSLDPVEFAGEIVRKKGKVIIVGSVPTGFSRQNYYKKELELKMSCSYGPGRYDLQYEEKGIDYPYAYTRWTEQRNMESFVDLLREKRLSIKSLVTHSYSLDDAPKAYDMILSSNEYFSGIIIKYSIDTEIKASIRLKSEIKIVPNTPTIGFVGAGSFAKGTLLPVINKHLVQFVGVVNSSGNSSRFVAEKYGFSYCASTVSDIFSDDHINTVFITTRHDLHAKMVVKAIQNGKNIYVEKPLAMSFLELDTILKHYSDFSNSKEECAKQPKLMVGFNRRFAPSVHALYKKMNDELPKSILIRVNAGALPADHWVNDPEIGGGRIIGEVCHFVDLVTFLSKSKVKTLYAESMTEPLDQMDTININLKMENGSIANISYFSNGCSRLPKEYIEVFQAGKVYQIDDYKRLTIFHSSGVKNKRFKGMVKGHKESVHAFLTSIIEGKPSPIPFEESYHSTLVTLKILESLRMKCVQFL